MSFSDKINRVRMKMYLSQEALAKEVGISITTVNCRENGRGKPNSVMEEKYNDFCEKHNIKFEEKK